MFDNVGSKLKGFAIAEFVCCIILVLIFAINSWVNDEFWVGLIIAISGFLGAWLASLLLYGVGVVAESAEKAVFYAEQAAHMATSSVPVQNSIVSPSPAKSSAPASTGPVGWTCKGCGKKNSSTSISCKSCGALR